MPDVLSYFIEVNLAIAIFYLFYRLLLHNDTFFVQKRFAFLLTYLFTCTFPFINLSDLFDKQKELLVFVQTLDTRLPDFIITPSSHKYSLLDSLAILYGVVSGFLLLRLGRQIVSLTLLSLKTTRILYKGTKLVRLPVDQAPFSFLGWIFVHTEGCSERDLDEIIQHEKVHIRQHHTLDVLLAEFVCIVFWINPFSWLIKRRVRENLEYLADNEVIRAGFNTQSYQFHLLRMSSHEDVANMANHFNVTHLKKRIIMMNKQKTSLMGLTKYALFMPLFAFFVLAAQAWGQETLTSTAESLSEAAQANSALSNPPIPQATQSQPVVQKNEAAQNVSENAPRLSAEKMPVFPGGDQGLIDYITKNVHYPTSAQQLGVEGRVMVRFVVDIDGSVKDIEVVRSLNTACDEEATRVIKAMPKWTPAQNKGKAVKVFYTIPILFKLSKGTPPPPPLLASPTLVEITDGKSTTTVNAILNKSLMLIVVDNKQYQIVGIDPSKASEKEILNALNLPNAEVESIIIMKGKAAEQSFGEAGKNGVIVIATKK